MTAQQPLREYCPDYYKPFSEWVEGECTNERSTGDCETQIKDGKCPRTRPHTPAPFTSINRVDLFLTNAHTTTHVSTNCKGCESDSCATICQDWIKDHDAAIARTATLATLNAITEEFNRLRYEDGWNLWKGQEVIDKMKAESLRTAAQEDKR